MDLSILKKKAVFVPTPGQTEQEYLAEFHSKNGNCPFFTQKHFDLVKAIELVEKFHGLSVFFNSKQLNGVVRNFLRSLE
jgi:hypothetical protein